MRRFTEQFQRFLILLFQIRCAIPWVYNVVALRNLFSAKTIEQALFQYEIGQGALVHLSTRQHLKESKTVLALWVYKQALLGKVALGTWAAGPMVSVPQSTNSWGRDPDAVAKFYEEKGEAGPVTYGQKQTDIGIELRSACQVILHGSRSGCISGWIQDDLGVFMSSSNEMISGWFRRCNYHSLSLSFALTLVLTCSRGEEAQRTRRVKGKARWAVRAKRKVWFCTVWKAGEGTIFHGK